MKYLLANSKLKKKGDGMKEGLAEVGLELNRCRGGGGDGDNGFLEGSGELPI